MIIWIHFVWLFSWSWWCVVIRLDVHHEKAVQICSVLDCLKPLAIPLAWSLQLGSWASHFWSSEDGGSSSQPEEFELNSQQRQCSYNIIIYELHLPDSGTWQSLRLSGMVCTQFCTAKSSTAIRSLRTKGAQRLDRHKTLDDRTSNDWLKSTWYLRSTDLYRSLQISTDLYRSLQISTDLYRSLQISTDLYRSLQISTDLYDSRGFQMVRCQRSHAGSARPATSSGLQELLIAGTATIVCWGAALFSIILAWWAIWFFICRMYCVCVVL